MRGLMGTPDDDEGGPFHENFIHTISYFANVIQMAKDHLINFKIANSNLFNQFIAFLKRMLQISDVMGGDLDKLCVFKLLIVALENNSDYFKGDKMSFIVQICLDAIKP
jgi:hypothetical protein